MKHLSTGVLAALAGFAGADTWFVNAGATGDGTGQSWTHAFATLRGALAAARPGDEIWVAAGVYTPSDDDATAAFQMRSGIGVYGGFAGHETTRGARDWQAYPTILSGDIGHDDTDNPFLLHTDNSGHVLDASGVDESAILDGFIIERGAYGPAGTPAGHPLLMGSGLYVVSGSPTVRNCTFRRNYAAFGSGGAVYLWDSNPRFSDCRFESNQVHLGNGGAMYIGGTSAPVIEDCGFTGNTCISGQPDSSGGAVYHQSHAPLTVKRCRFVGNVIRPFYSIGTDVGYGGGISSFYAPITVIDSVFEGNQANYGAGMIAWNEATIINSVFTGNVATARARDPYPEAGGYGAGFMANSFVARTMRLINCTFNANRGKEATVYGGWNSTVDVRNCILWNNTGTKPDVIGYFREEIGGNFDLSFSCIRAIFGPAAQGEDPLEPEKTVGCIDDDPRFVAGPGERRLSAGSPAIDAGRNANWTPAFWTDFAGNARMHDDPVTPDTGEGTAPIIDMGAFEFGAAPVRCPADLSGSSDPNDSAYGMPDGFVDASDFFFYLDKFVAGDLAIADLSGSSDPNDPAYGMPDGTIDAADFFYYLDIFVEECP